MERDPKKGIDKDWMIISTHTLTWSVTSERLSWHNQTAISTHTLTWSVTGTGGSYHGQAWYFNSHAHVERDPTSLSVII